MAKTLANLNVIIDGRTKGLEKKLKRIERQVDRWGFKMNRIGKNLTQSVSAPMLAIIGFGTKMELELSSNFTKINNLVGVSTDQLETFKNGVRSISSSIGIAQTDLSKALFVITSAGVRGSEALDILEQSAKASVVGLGDVQSIARASTSVLNAYGTENITAAEAANVLYNTVKEGNVDAETLAGSLGGVIGIASQLGVTFAEVGANIATYTRLGVTASEASTGLAATLSNFLNPAAKTREALAQIGLTAQDVRNRISQQGLSSTLAFLIKQFEGNYDAIGSLIPNIRSLKNVLGVAGNQADDYLKIAKALESNTDGLSNAYAKSAKGPMALYNKAMTGLKNSASELGTVMIPFMVSFAKRVTSLTDRFSRLDDRVKRNIVKWGLIVSAIGPALIILGKLSSVVLVMSRGLRLLTGVVRGLGAAIAFLTSPVGLVVSALAALSAGVLYAIYNWDAIKGRISQTGWWRNAFISIIQSLQRYNPFSLLIRGYNALVSKFGGQKISNPFDVLGDYLDTLKTDAVETNTKFKTIGQTVKEIKSDLFGAFEAPTFGQSAPQGAPIANTGFSSGAIASSPTSIGSGGTSNTGSGDQVDSGGVIERTFKAIEDRIAMIPIRMIEATEQIQAQLPAMVSPFNQLTEHIAANFDLVAGTLSNMFSNAFDSIAQGGKLSLKSLLSPIGAIIKKLAVAALTAFVLSTLLGGIGVGSLGGKTASFKNIFSGLSGLSFYHGTTRTPRGDADSRGGVMAIVHPNERVVPDYLNKQVGYNVSNTELVQSYLSHKAQRVNSRVNNISARSSQISQDVLSKHSVSTDLFRPVSSISGDVSKSIESMESTRADDRQSETTVHQLKLDGRDLIAAIEINNQLKSIYS